MPKKDFKAYQQMIEAFHTFIADKHWSISEEKEVNHGHQIVVTDGKVKAPVTFYPSGKTLIHGSSSSLKAEIQAWNEEYKQVLVPAGIHSQPASPSVIAAQPAPVIPLTSIPTQQPPEHTASNEQATLPRIGLAIAGKDDYFGPLVFCALYMDIWVQAELKRLGVPEYNTFTDERMIAVGEALKKSCPHYVGVLINKRYNETYTQVHDMRKLLAWGNIRALENILQKAASKRAVVEQAGDIDLIQKVITQKEMDVTLEQQAPQEEDIAVAAAQVLARAEYLQRMAYLSRKIGQKLPTGDSDPEIVTIAREIFARGGRNALAEVAKLHFKITAQIIKE